VNAILSRCDYIDKHWNDEIKLTPRTIKKIVQQVEEQADDELF